MTFYFETKEELIDSLNHEEKREWLEGKLSILWNPFTMSFEKYHIDNCYEDPTYWATLETTIQEWDQEVKTALSPTESTPDPTQLSFSFYPK